MSRVNSFEFASDDTYADPSTCTINWSTSTVSVAGLSVPFAQVDEFAQAIEDLHGQSVADNIAETQKKVLAAAGGSDITLSYNPAGSPAPTQTFGINTFPSVKAADLASGLRAYVLAEL